MWERSRQIAVTLLIALLAAISTYYTTIAGLRIEMAGKAEDLLERALRDFESARSPLGPRMLNSDLVIARSELEHLRGPLAIGIGEEDLERLERTGVPLIHSLGELLDRLGSAVTRGAQG